MLLRTNAQNLVVQSVLGSISHPSLSLKNPYLVDTSGCARVVPGTGGITYNVAVGDSALDFVGDHVEPGVSVSVDGRRRDGSEEGGLSILACIGNEARVTGGPAVGLKGIVTGKHGGVEHVLVDFPPSVLEKLVVGDSIQIKAFGQGLKLKDLPDVHLMNIDPGLPNRMGIIHQGNRLVVPVAYVLPASIMGSGIGSRHSFSGDYDIQIANSEAVQKYGLQNLRLGDVVAIRDADCRFGRSLRRGAISVGIVVHASCITGGHGPGVTVVMTTERDLILPRIEQHANISNYLKIGRSRRRVRAKRRRKQ